MVRALASDSKEGAKKAARNAAIRVIDEFNAHTLKRDMCAKENLAEPEPVRRPDPGDRQEVRARQRALQKELRAILKRYDPEKLFPEAPADEYASEETELLRLVIHGDVTHQTVREIWQRMFGPDSKLLSSDRELYGFTREITACQTRWNSTLEWPPIRAVS
jgi:hypothetical protein